MFLIQDFYSKPRLLINMHDNDPVTAMIPKNNRAHLRTMAYLGTTHVIFSSVRFLRYRVYELAVTTY